MPRYAKQPLEEKLAWMRERQRAKEAEVRRKEEDELAARLSAEQAADVRELMRLKEAIRTVKLAGFDSLPPNGLPPERKMLRVETVAQQLSVSVQTVRRWFADRAVVVRPGPRRTTMLIPQETLDDWFSEHERKPSSRSG